MKSIEIVILIILIIVILIIIIYYAVQKNSTINNFLTKSEKKSVNKINKKNNKKNNKEQSSSKIFNRQKPKYGSFQDCLNAGEGPAFCRSQIIQKCMYEKNDIQYCMNIAPNIGTFKSIGSIAPNIAPNIKSNISTLGITPIN